MARGSYSIERVSPQRLLVRLCEQLDQPEVESLRHELLPALPSAHIGPQIVFDLTGLRSCTTAARQCLADLQALLGGVKARTSYVADSPRFRGVGLWIAHTSGDMSARSFHTMQQAEAWLASSEGRIESIMAYLGRDGRRGSAGRGSKSKSKSKSGSRESGLLRLLRRSDRSSGDGD